MFHYYSTIMCYCLKCFTLNHKIFHSVSRWFRNCSGKLGSCLQLFEWFWVLSSWKSAILARPSSCLGSGSGPLLWIYWNSIRRSWRSPTQSDPVNSPPCRRKAEALDRRRDEELAAVLSSGLSQLRCQALLDLLRHPEFNIKDVQSPTIVQLLLRLERPFTECAVSTYNLWKL